MWHLAHGTKEVPGHWFIGHILYLTRKFSKKSKKKKTGRD